MMKICDVVVIVASALGLSALVWDKVAVEALISGLVIGGYIGWRLWRGA